VLVQFTETVAPLVRVQLMVFPPSVTLTVAAVALKVERPKSGSLVKYPSSGEKPE